MGIWHPRTKSRETLKTKSPSYMFDRKLRNAASVTSGRLFSSSSAQPSNIW